MSNNSLTWEEIASQAQFQPAKMADLCSVSLRTVQRHFRKHYALSVAEWLRSIRMKEAKRRILAGDSIKAVAIDLGFKQPSHFSRVFKESYGVPPSFLLQSEAVSRFPTKLYSSSETGATRIEQQAAAEDFAGNGEVLAYRSQTNKEAE